MTDAPSTPRATGYVPTMGYGDYLRFSKLVSDRFGLNFPEKRRADLEMGVRQAFAASTCATLDDYYNLLEDPRRGTVEVERLVNALTIGETHFFRDSAQFDALYYHVLPQIIERRRSLRTMRIWSAGCASGEEPYSIAMALRDLLPDVDDWSITILGTDVNTKALDRARKGLYSEWAFREERAKQAKPRYFTRSENRCELKQEVRRMVSFRWLNLADSHYPSVESNTTLMDMILCRNVTIYFTEPVIREVVRRLYDSLVNGGWLVVGHSEPSLVTYYQFQAYNSYNTVLYRRADLFADGLKDVGVPVAFPTFEKPVEKPARRVVSVPSPPPPPPPARDAAPDITTDLDEAPTEEADPLDRARELLGYGRSEEARDMLLELAATRRERAVVSALLGAAYANLGCWTDAEHWCLEAIGSDKLMLEAYYTLSLVCQHQGRLADAVGAMKKVVYIDHTYVLGHFGLADLYHADGRLPQAQKSLDNALRLLEGHPPDELVAGSGGITVGRLRETIVRQQQRWNAEASGVSNYYDL